MALEIRTVTDDEFAAWSRVISTAFFGTPPSAEQIADRRQNVDLDRCWAAFDGDQPVATLRTFPAELTLPGAVTVTADAVTSVTTLSTHRRQGALRAMMTASLAQATDRGDAVSILISARWPIYGRYGYGPATEASRLQVDTRAVTVRGNPEGSLAFTDAATARAVAEPVYDAYRRGQVGAITRRSWIFDRDFGLIGHQGSGPVEGLLRRPSRRRRQAGRLPALPRGRHVARHATRLHPRSIDDLVATTPSAYADLWRLCISTDNVTTRHGKPPRRRTSRCAGCWTTAAPSPSTSAATSSGYGFSTCRPHSRPAATSPKAGW